MVRYIIAFKMLVLKSWKSEEPLSEKHKQKIFLNGIRDRDYDEINDQFDSLSLPDTILKLKENAINIGTVE